MTTALELASEPTFELKVYAAKVGNPEMLAYQNDLASAYDKACLSLLGPNDVVKADGRTFKTKAAWRKLARHFNISVDIVRIEREMIAEHFVATVTARAVAPWGQRYEEVGACSTGEATGRRVITVADAIATASTRASNRAISNLIAMGEVSAEEIQEQPAKKAAAPAGNRDLTWKGQPLTEYASGDLVKLRAWCVKKDPKGFAGQIEAIDALLVSREGQ